MSHLHKQTSGRMDKKTDSTQRSDSYTVMHGYAWQLKYTMSEPCHEHYNHI